MNCRYSKEKLHCREQYNLKRHRNLMFKDNDDAKPISIIITTLAARAYQGELDITSALTNILLQMGNYVNNRVPRVPNPVSPPEDFADRWAMPKYKHLNLENNFWNWLTQAKADFETIISSDDTQFMHEQIMQKFSLSVDSSLLRRKLGLSPAVVSVITPKKHAISAEPASPWKVRL